MGLEIQKVVGMIGLENTTFKERSVLLQPFKESNNLFVLSIVGRTMTK